MSFLFSFLFWWGGVEVANKKMVHFLEFIAGAPTLSCACDKTEWPASKLIPSGFHRRLPARSGPPLGASERTAATAVRAACSYASSSHRVERSPIQVRRKLPSAPPLTAARSGSGGVGGSADSVCSPPPPSPLLLLPPPLPLPPPPPPSAACCGSTTTLHRRLAAPGSMASLVVPSSFPAGRAPGQSNAETLPISRRPHLPNAAHPSVALPGATHLSAHASCATLTFAACFFIAAVLMLAKYVERVVLPCHGTSCTEPSALAVMSMSGADTGGAEGGRGGKRTARTSRMQARGSARLPGG